MPQPTETAPGVVFFVESEGTRTDDARTLITPAPMRDRMAASGLAANALRDAGMDVDVPLAALLRDLALWYQVPEDDIRDLAGAIKTYAERTARVE